MDVDYTYRGISHLEKEQIDDAISDFNKAIDTNPGNSVAYFSRGRAYYKQSKTDNAISDYNKAIEISPEYTAAYQSRGYAYYSLDDYTQAISDYDKALQINPEDAATYNMRGIAYYKQGNIENALSDYNKAIEIAPEFSAAYQNRGDVYQTISNDLAAKAKGTTHSGGITFSSLREKGTYKKAISDYKKAIELNPENFDAYINRGHIYFSRGKYKKAVSDYNKAIELNPEVADVKRFRDSAASFLNPGLSHFSFHSANNNNAPNATLGSGEIWEIIQSGSDPGVRP